MNDLRIIRGKDVKMTVDDELLFGMTEFSSEEKRKYHDVYEYLSDKPLQRIPGHAAYTIKLAVMTLFCDQIPHDRRFTLCVRCDETEYVYEGCAVTASKSEINGATGGSQVFTIEADRMTERVIDDE